MPTFRVSDEKSEKLEALAVERTVRANKIISKAEVIGELIENEYDKFLKGNKDGKKGKENKSG